MTTNALSSRLRRLMPSLMVLRASMSNPESVSSSIANFGSSMAICNISFLFFSPPLNPSLTFRWRKSGFISTILHFSMATPKNSNGSSSASPLAFLFALSMSRKKSVLPTPGNSTGYWKARKTPFCAASWASSSSKSSPSRVAVPLVASYAGCLAKTLLKVLLPEPFGPMMAWTSPGRTSKSNPFKMGCSFSTTLASMFSHLNKGSTSFAATAFR